MKKIFITIILILIGIIAGYFIHLDPGYIAVYYAGVSIETSLWVGILIIALTFTVLHFLIRLLSHITRLNQYIQRWSDSRSSTKQKNLTTKGINQYAQKDWKQAEKSLTKAAALSQAPLENYLNAAKAAQQLGAYDRRDEHLQTAYEQVVESRPAILMTQANLQIEAQQFELAIVTLSTLLQKDPLYKPALSLLYTAYKIVGDWKALHRLLPTLKEQKAISSSAINEIEEDIALIEITKAAHQPTTMGLESLWKTFSKNIQTSPRVLEQYVKALIQLHDYDHAQKRIEKTLAAVWVPTLVPLYTLIKSHNTAKLIVTAEKWLKRHPKDKTLLFCLAKMSFSSSFYPKASQYIQQLISIEPSAAAWSLLGEIHEAQQQLPEAIACYKNAIHAR